MIGSVDLAVAIRAAARKQANIGERSLRHSAARDQLRRMERLRMALLAQKRARGDEQLLVVRTVRRVAVDAAVAHRSMLEQEWPALLSVTGEADFVDAVRLEQWSGRAAMRVMAVDTADPSLEQRHMRAARKLRALSLVALEARFVDGGARLQTPEREIRHRIVAIGAGEVAALVGRARPEDPLSTAMTIEAHAVLVGDGL